MTDPPLYQPGKLQPSDFEPPKCIKCESRLYTSQIERGTCSICHHLAAMRAKREEIDRNMREFGLDPYEFKKGA